MPIKVDRSLPAVDILRTENIFVMDDNRAKHQDIRPMNILILNLMPQKTVTETQLLRLLANTPLQLEVEFLHMASHQSKNTHSDHLNEFYTTFEEIKDRFFDGLIVTGAPVENLPFEEVDYWDELVQVFDWSKEHVYSTLHICWGAQAGLYVRYGVQRHSMCCKLSGVYPQEVVKTDSPLMRGFNDEFLSPHSRYTEVKEDDIAHLLNLDVQAGIDPNVPENYFKGDDPTTRPSLSWNLPAAQFFNNWINYAVYQETPYDWNTFEQAAVSASL